LHHWIVVAGLRAFGAGGQLGRYISAGFASTTIRLAFLGYA
jgi:hypothetical protein